MPISFECPGCGFQTEVADRYAGQSGSCASCKKPITIPGAPLKKPKSRKSEGGTAWLVIGGLVGLAIIGSLLFAMLYMATTNTRPMILAPQVAASTKHQQACGDNLRRIGEAIRKYKEDKGHYPPAYVADRKGKPMHSWRVLILPYLGESDLFASYDMAKPWDDPVNTPLIARMPAVYRCPTEPDVMDQSTYMVISGEGFLFDKDTQRDPADLKDAEELTLMVVEVVESGVEWTDPQDIDSDAVDWSRSRRKGLGSKHDSGGLHVVTADGEVHHLGSFVTAEVLNAMATIDGGEELDLDSWTD